MVLKVVQLIVMTKYGVWHKSGCLRQLSEEKDN